MRVSFLSIIIAAAASGSVFAAPLSDKPGQIVPAKTEVFDESATAAERKAMFANLQQHAATVYRTQPFASLRGFNVYPNMRIVWPIDDMPSGTPLVGRAHIFLRDVSVPVAEADGNEGTGLFIHVNSLDIMLEEDVSSAKMDVLIAVTAPERRRGFDLIHLAREDVLVVARPDRMPFIPLTRGQRLQERSADLRANIAEFKDMGVDAPELRKQLAEIEGQLAAMTAEERRMPVCEDGYGQFTDCREGEFYTARANPDYFDRSLPRSAVQFLAIRHFSARQHPLSVPIHETVEALSANMFPLDIRP